MFVGLPVSLHSQTKSRWAQMARLGKKVMQFLSEGRYVANVVDVGLANAPLRIA
jgi:hypothetical protein